MMQPSNDYLDIEDFHDARRPTVLGIWHKDTGVPLALGKLIAMARSYREGALLQRYNIDPIAPTDEIAKLVTSSSGPLVILSSNYIWSLEKNLELLTWIQELRSDAIIVHGGPQTPQGVFETEAFLRKNASVADIVVRGEGELTLCDLLDRLSWDGVTWHLRDEPGGIPGASYLREHDGDTVYCHGPNRARISDLDSIPSPHLTGVFDRVVHALHGRAYLEGSRGCPYSCSFCDWGSATGARVHRYSLERLVDEINWFAKHGIADIGFADANFGMFATDVDIIASVGEAKERFGVPNTVLFCPAKNTTKYLANILDELVSADLGYYADLGLQTVDRSTLDAVTRTNISVERFIELADEFRRRSHSPQVDLLVGLPGDSFEGLGRTLQFCFDNDLIHRGWEAHLLPNSEMSDPDYRALHQIEVDSDNIVVSTSSYDRDERIRMRRLQRVDSIAVHFGLMKHLLLWAQSDHCVPAIAIQERLVEALERPEDSRYRSLIWTLRHFEQFGAPLGSWRRFYAELKDFVTDADLVPSGPELDTVMQVLYWTRAWPGRTFPATCELEHDFVAYFQQTAGLPRPSDELPQTFVESDARPVGSNGVANADVFEFRPLATFGPGELTVIGDPFGLCTFGLRATGQDRSDIENSSGTWSFYSNELLSDVMSTVPTYSFHLIADSELEAATRQVVMSRSKALSAESDRRRAVRQALSPPTKRRIPLSLLAERPTTDPAPVGSR